MQKSQPCIIPSGIRLFLHTHALTNPRLECRNAALESYKSGPGAAKAALLADNRAKLKNTKRRAKELGLAINNAKRQLDAAKAKADQLRASRIAKDTGDGASQVGCMTVRMI